MTQKQEMERAYLSMRPLLFGVCKRFHKKYGGDISELISEAHFHFVNVFLTHDPDRQTLEADVQYRVYCRLLETHTTESNRARLMNRIRYEEGMVESHDEAYFDLQEFLNKLSLNAAQVVKVALNPPPDVEMELVQSGRRDGKGNKMALRQYLLDMRWTIRQITESFQEVSKALSGDADGT